MKLVQSNFHKSFKLNGCVFTSIDEILEYSKDVSDEIYLFLKSWFSLDKTITVQTSGSTGIPKPICCKFSNSNGFFFQFEGAYISFVMFTTAIYCW